MGNYLDKHSRSLRRHDAAPLLHAHRRASLGAAGRHPWGWRRIQARRSTCLLLLAQCVQRRRVESLVLGALHHRQYTVLLCWYWGPTYCSGIVRLFEVV